MEVNIRQHIIDRLEWLESVYPCQFRVLDYYVGHHTLVIGAYHLDDLKLPISKQRRLYIECESVYYMKLVPHWERLPLYFLDEESTKVKVEKVGLFHDIQTKYLPCVLEVKGHIPEILIMCHHLYVHQERPKHMDYPEL